VAPRDFVVLGSEVQIPLFQANGILSRYNAKSESVLRIAFKLKVLATFSSFVTDYFSGSDRATSPVCVCLCVRTITVELDGLQRTCWIILTLSRSGIKVKIIGHE